MNVQAKYINRYALSFHHAISLGICASSCIKINGEDSFHDTFYVSYALLISFINFAQIKIKKI